MFPVTTVDALKHPVSWTALYYGRADLRGLASAAPERMIAGGKTIEVARVRISDEGRKALAEAKS